MKSKIVLIASVVVGLIAFLLTGQYLRSERDKLYAGAEKTTIIAAYRDMPAGTKLKLEDLATKEVFKSSIGQNVFREQDKYTVENKELIFPIKRGDPLLWSHINIAMNGRGGLASMVKPGLRAISIAVSGAAAVSGLVQPNDHVDLLGNFAFPSGQRQGETEAVTLTLLQDVTVLATGSRMNPQGGAYGPDTWQSQGSGYSTVTLEVSPREAEILTFAQSVKGQLVLSLRNESDVKFERYLPVVNFTHIQTNVESLNMKRQIEIRHKKDL